jgi:hypothetical protein
VIAELREDESEEKYQKAFKQTELWSFSVNIKKGGRKNEDGKDCREQNDHYLFIFSFRCIFRIAQNWIRPGSDEVAHFATF